MPRPVRSPSEPEARARLARKYQPQLATLVQEAPDGAEWLHEIKYDGYRIGCTVSRGVVTLISRNAMDWTASFPEICEAVRRLPVSDALLDGEIAVVLRDGRTSFQGLQNLSGGVRRRLAYFVFDLLRLNGRDLSRVPLEERKRALFDLVAQRRGPEGDRIRYSDHILGNGPAFLAEACRLKLEGIVSKRRDSLHRPGRTNRWLKTKCISRQEFVIGGFTDPEGAREGIGALLVGYYDESGHLRFSGKVGTGFTHEGARALRARLDSLERKKCPFDPPPGGPLGKRAHWVRPDLVGEVTFTEWTDDGHLRHPSFKGLRKDKRSRDVVLEHPRGA